MGRPPHRPSPLHRRQAEVMASHGVPETEIAQTLGIDPKTLRRHYRRELDLGHVRANARVAETLLRKASGDGRHAVTAAIFWLKTRAGWHETSVHDLSGGARGEIDRNANITNEAPEARTGALARLLGLARAEAGGPFGPALGHAPDRPASAVPVPPRLPLPADAPGDARPGTSRAGSDEP